MHINPPILIQDTGEPMYNTKIYFSTRYPIENIYESIEKWYLSEASIPHGDSTLNIYDIGDEWYNIFILDKDWIEENFWLSKEESIGLIKSFIS